MTRMFLVRGMLVGILAGLLSFGFLKLYGEPQVDRAIAFETQLDEAKAAAERAKGVKVEAAPELVSRRVQAGIGLFTAVLVYCTAFGGLFGLAFAFAYGRVGSALHYDCSLGYRHGGRYRIKTFDCAAIWRMERDPSCCCQLPHIGGGRRIPIADNQRGSRRVTRGCAVEIPNCFDWCTIDHVGHSRCAIRKLDRTGFFQRPATGIVKRDGSGFGAP
jgi:hypothetical protein